MPDCGSQVILCELPIRFDTYKGCSHGCEYCFVKKKVDIREVVPFEGVQALKNFVEGKRTKATNWCDWDIPLHWGGVSDPFQPAERVHRRSLECLEYLAETQYPFVVSTKGKLIAEPEYTSILSKCNAVVQVSMVCSKYDAIEPGAPTFEERMSILEVLAKNSRRLIVRISPYSVGLHDEICELMPRYKNAGVFGIEIEGMKRSRKHPGFVKVGGDWCFPVDVLRREFSHIKQSAKQEGLSFFAGENRLRLMGDDTCCCGTYGLSGFSPNKANLNRTIEGEAILYTEKMKEKGTARAFLVLAQKQDLAIQLEGMSYEECMEIASRSRPFLEVMGLRM